MAGKDDKNKKGFSGLSDLVSDISVTSGQTGVNRDTGTKPPPSPKPTPAKPREILPQEQHQSPTVSPVGLPSGSGQGGGSSGAKWVIFSFAVVIVVAIWLAEIDDPRIAEPHHSPPTPSRSYAPTTTSTTSPPTSSTLHAPTIQCEKPPVGQEHVLSLPQICWCLREDIRLEAIRDVADTGTEVARFNCLVADYNSRCGSYRYYASTLEQAERAIEPHRSEIAAEARREVLQWGQSISPTQPTVKPDVVNEVGLPKQPSYQDTREAQKLLTAWGYSPGPIDGDYDISTRNAVKAFQRDMGITQDGLIDRELLSLLREVSASSSSASQSLTTTRPTVSNSSPRPSPHQQPDRTPPVTARSAKPGPTLSSTTAPENLSFEDQSRYGAAERLRKLGYDVDWRTATLSHMLDAETRIHAAERLGKLGYDVDWRTTSLTHMLDAESRIHAAERLKRNGITVDWRNYSLTQLLSMRLK